MLRYQQEDAASVAEVSDPAVDAQRDARLRALHERLAGEGKLASFARLMPTTAATTVRSSASDPVVLDGPLADTREQLVGIYVVAVRGLDEALALAHELTCMDVGVVYELRPMFELFRGVTAERA